MKTASFFTYSGAGRVSIARFPPRSTPPGFRVYRALAPGSWFNTSSLTAYRRLYFAQLSMLDPAKVVEDLTRLAAGAEPVLLCWERPPWTATNFCHRRMVAEWLQQSLAITVDELVTR